MRLSSAAMLLALASSIATASLLSAPAFAHHTAGHNGDDVHVPIPVPVVPPPPVQPPPAPVTPAATAAPLQFNFQAPLLPSNSLTPTDMSGIGGALGASKGVLRTILDGLRPQAQQKQANVEIARDKRYNFSGTWLPVELNELSEPVEEAEFAQDTAARKGRAVFYSNGTSHAKVSQFMPTHQARYTRVTNNELEIRDGAVIVKPGAEPLFVSTTTKGKKVLTKVDTGAMALISNINDEAMVMNLTDCHCGSCMMCCSDSEQSDQKVVSVPVEVGQMAAVCGAGSKHSAEPYVASKVLCRHKISAGLSVSVCQWHCVSALRRFNLDRALNGKDLQRVIKTAAASLYAHRGRH
jgi:hypothetical protein